MPNRQPADLIDVHINGELRQVPGNQSVSGLLSWLGVAAERVAIELDKSIVRKRDWESTRVAGGSHVEIVEFVGGG